MQKFIKELQIDSKSTLIITPNELLEKILGEVIEFYTNKKNLSTILISLNKPYKKIEEFLSIKGINKDLVFVVDCITRNGEMKSGQNVHYVDPSDLTKIGIVIRQLMNNITGKKALIIDELKAFSFYNELDYVVKFIRSIVGQAQKFDTNVCMITTEDKELTDTIVGIFDNINRMDVYQYIKQL